MLYVRGLALGAEDQLEVLFAHVAQLGTVIKWVIMHL
jgi:hypothetical protein